MPYRAPARSARRRIVYDSGDYAGLLDKALAPDRLGRAQAEVKQRRAGGEAGRHRPRACLWKRAASARPTACRSRRYDRRRRVVTGGASVGQGFETVIAQVCADALGVDYSAARRPRPHRPHRVRHRRACLARHRHDGVATARCGGEAARQGARHRGANCCKPRRDVLDIVDGEVVRRDGPAGPSISLGEDRPPSCARPPKPLGDREPGLCRRRLVPAPSTMSIPTACHIAVVRVDRETGGVAIERYLHRLRYRPRHQSGAGRGPDRRRLRAGSRRRAVRGIHL